MNNLIKIRGINTFKIGVICLAEFDTITTAAVAAANVCKVILRLT
jgi:hypothetical protein